MKPSTFLPLAATTLLASTAAADAGCAADYILKACLETENAILAACSTADWNCRCAAQKAISTCYNNCPDDPARLTQAGQEQIFCGYASQFPSSASAAKSTASSAVSQGADVTDTDTAATTTGKAASATKTTSKGGSTSTDTAAASKTSSAPASVNTNAGARERVHDVAGIMAVVAGVVSAVL